MITQERARQIAAQHIEEGLENENGTSFRILDEDTLTEDFGWVFFYQTDAYLRTGDLLDCAVGNGPLIVDRQDGRLTEGGTAYPAEVYIEEYRAERRSRTPANPPRE